jgi:hypothetical protein
MSGGPDCGRLEMPEGLIRNPTLREEQAGTWATTGRESERPKAHVSDLGESGWREPGRENKTEDRRPEGTRTEYKANPRHCRILRQPSTTV